MPGGQRRRNLMQAFRRLRDLPPNERERLLSGPEIEERFSPDERRLLEGLLRLLPEPQAEGPVETPPGSDD